MGSTIHCPHWKMLAKLHSSSIPELPLWNSITGQCSQTKEMTHDWPKVIGALPSYFASIWGCYRQMVQLLSKKCKRTDVCWDSSVSDFLPWYKEGFVREELCPFLPALDLSHEDRMVSAGIAILPWADGQEKQLRAMTSLIFEWTLIQPISDCVYVKMIIPFTLFNSF